MRVGKFVGMRKKGCEVMFEGCFVWCVGVNGLVMEGVREVDECSCSCESCWVNGGVCYIV